MSSSNDQNESPRKRDSLRNRASASDLKNQLFDIQQKFNNRKSGSHNAGSPVGAGVTSAGTIRDTTNIINNDNRRSYPQPEIHLPPSILPSTDEAREAREARQSRRESLPIMSVRRKTSAQLSQAAPQPSPNANINFLTDLSDGLLVESRRLNYENRKLKQKAEDLEQEDEALKRQISNLTLINKKLSEKEESFNDKIWELETENGNLIESLEKVQQEVSKVVKENQVISGEFSELQAKFESLKVQKIELEKDSSTKLNQTTNELVDLKARNSDLNDENDVLHQKVQKLTSELEEASKKGLRMIPDLNPFQQDSEHDVAEFDDSMLIDPSTSPAKQLGETNDVLEKETLQANLQHAHQTIVKLRQSLMKFRVEKEDLEKRLSNATTSSSANSSAISKNIPRSAKKKSKFDSRSPNTSGFSPSNRNSKVFSYYEDSDDVTNEWDNFEVSSSNKVSKLNKIPKLVRSEDEDSSDEDSQEVGQSKLISDNVLIDELDELSDEFSIIKDSRNGITESQIEAYAEKNNLKLISLDEYVSLTKMNPTETQLEKSIIEASTDFGLIALPNDDTNTHDTFDQLKIKCADLNMVPVDIFEYESLLKKSNYDDIDETVLMSKIDKFGLKLLPLDEFDDLKSKVSSQEETITSWSNPDYYQSQAQTFNLVTLPVDEHKKLTTALNAKESELVALISTLEEKEQSLLEKSKEMESVQTQLTVTQQKLQEPDIDYAKSAADKHGFLAIPREEHSKLLSDLESHQETVSQKEAELNEKLTELESLNKSLSDNKSELEILKTKIDQPSAEYFKEKASLHDFVVLPITEHDSLKSTIDSKLVELESTTKKIQDLEAQLQSKHDELSTVKTQLDNPDVDYVKSKAADHNLITLSKEEHGSITSELNSKSERLLSTDTELAALKSQFDATAKELEDTQKKLEAPDLEYIKEKADLHGHVMLKSETHDELNKSISNTQSELANVETDLISKTKQLELIQAELAEKDVNLNGLKDQFEKPDEDYIRSKAGSHGLIAITMNDHNELKNSLEQKTTDLASIQSDLELKITELDSVKHDLASIQSDLELKITELDSVKHDLSLKSDALESATNDLQVATAGLNSTSAELQSSKEQIASLNTELEAAKENISSLEKEIGLLKTESESLKSSLNASETELISNTRQLEELNGKLENPDAEYIKQKSESHGLIAIPITEHNSLIESLTSKDKKLENLNTKFNSPDAEHIKSKAADVGLVALSIEDHASLNKSLDDKHESLIAIESELSDKKKSIMDLEKKFNDKHESLIAVENELSQTKNSIEDLEKSLNDKHESLIAVENELSQKKRSIEDLEKSLDDKHESLIAVENELSQKKKSIEDLEKSIDDKVSELSSIQNKLESPSSDYIKEKSQLHNLVVLESPDHEQLISSIDSKSKEIESMKSELENKIKEIGKLELDVTSTKQELESVQKAFESPDTDYIRNKATLHGMVAVSSEEHENMKTDLSSTLDQVAKLTTQIQSPGKDYILSKSADHKLIAVDVEKYNGLTSELVTKSEEIVKLSNELHDKKAVITDLSSQLKQPSTDYLSDKATAAGLSVIPTSELRDLRSPSKDAIISQASAVGLTAIASSTYETMKQTSEKPSLNFLTSSLSGLGYQAVPIAEYGSLVSKAASVSTGALSGAASLAAASVGATGAITASAIGSAINTPSPKKNSTSSPKKSPMSSPKKLNFESVDTPERLKKKCSDMGLIALSKSSYESLIVSSKRSLTTVELIERIEKSGMYAIPKHDYKQLLSLIGSQGPQFKDVVARLETPGSSNMESSVTELRSLIDQQVKQVFAYKSPSEEYVTSKAEELGLKVLTLQEFSKMGLKKEPNSDEAKAILESKGFAVVPQDKLLELTALEDQVNKPTIEFVTRLSSLVGLSTLTAKELDSHKNPSKESVIEFAKSHSLVPVESHEYESLKSERSQLVSLGTELESLKKQVEHPELDFIKEKAIAHGHMVVSLDADAKLKENTKLLETELEGLKQKHDSTLSELEQTKLLETELESLKQEHDSTLSELEQTKVDLHTKIADLATLNTQLEEPSEDYLKSKSGYLGLIAVPIAEHDSLKKALSSAIASLKAKDKDVTTKRLDVERLESEAESQLQVIESLKNEIATKVEAIEKLTLSVENPDIEYVRSKASEHGLQAIPVDDYKSLQVEVSNKSESLEEKETEISKLKGLLSEVEHELQEVKLVLEKPEADFVKEKAQLHGLIAIPTVDEEQLRASIASQKSELEFKSKEIDDHLALVGDLESKLNVNRSETEQLREKYDNPDAEYIKTKSENLGFVAIPMEEHSSLKSLISEHTEQIESLRSKLEEPDADYIKSKSAAHGLISISTDDHRELQNSLDEQQEQLLNKTSELDALKKDLDEREQELAAIKLQIESPAPEYLREKASAHDLVVVESNSYSSVLNDVQSKSNELAKLKKTLEDKIVKLQEIEEELASKQLEAQSVKALLDAPDVDYISEKAASRDMILISIAEHETLNEKANSPSVELSKSVLQSSGHVAVVQEDYDQLLNDINNPSKEKVIGFAKAHSIVPLSVEEHTELNSSISTKQAEIEDLKSKLNDPEYVSEHIKSFGMVTVKSEKYESLKADLSTKESNLKDLKEQVESPSVDYLLAKSQAAGLVAISLAEYEELKSKLASPSAELITEKASALDLKVLSQDEYNKLLESKNSPPLELCKSVLAIGGLIAVPQATYKALDEKASSLESTLSSKDSDVKNLTASLDAAKSNIAELEAKLSLIDSLELKLNEISNESLTKDSEIVELTKKIENPSKSYIFEKLSGMGYAALKDAPGSRESMISDARDSVYVDAVSHRSETDTEDDDDDLFEENIGLEERLKKKAAELGYALVPLNELNDDLTSIESAEITEVDRAHVAATYEGAEKMEQSIDPESLKASAKALGLEVITVDELNELKSLQNIDANKLEEIATSMGLSVVSSSKIVSEMETGLVTKRAIQHSASELGLSVLSKADIERLKKRTVTAEELASKAAELNLTLISENELSELKSRTVLTQSELEAQAKKNGYMCIPTSQYVATTVSRKPDIPHVVVLPATYYNKLMRSHEWYKSKKDLIEEPPTAPPTAPPNAIATAATTADYTIVTDNDMASISGSLHKFRPRQLHDSPASQASATFSLNELVRNPTHTPSLYTVNTYISSNREMLAAITQTIIGEYLFKYYRRLGPFSVLSESRHERYFWIHPYSLTLYWSTTNPVLGDPSETKIRALAIVGVESVEDNNPLPPGLYHKSIIIHSNDRSVKITCPTRQRHNIWFNSLRFLIERSTDDLVDDDDDENQYNESYEVEDRAEIERSQSFRHSQPRKNMLNIPAAQSNRAVSSPTLPRSHTSRSFLTSIITNHNRADNNI